MDARAIIAKVRDKHTPTQEELQWFANGLADRSVSDAQAGAFAMAVLLNGLGDEGRVNLTLAMRDSGDVLEWDLPGPVLDKHSTGGVGDCVSLIFAPALAACGVFVPMISGRGLGHTGGTLDKMESIPGVCAQISEDQLHEVTAKVGCAIVGATAQLAPADRRLYAIRDVTSTVESVDLITASILSKKLASTRGGLILDVKAGSGAFMKSTDDARRLATALVTTANGAGSPTAALISDMDEPLAPVMGNALEVTVCMEVLAGNRAAAPRLYDLTVALGGKLLSLAGVENEDEGEAAVAKAIDSGQAMERFSRLVAELGGPPDMEADWHTHLPKAPVIRDVVAPEGGHLASVNGEALGLTVVGLGGGRRVETDKIDPSVGITEFAPLGTKFARGDRICQVHARSDAVAQEAEAAILAAIALGDKPESRPLIREVIG